VSQHSLDLAERIAIHETGHAIISLEVGLGVEFVTVCSGRDYVALCKHPVLTGDRITLIGNGDYNSGKKLLLECELRVLLAGMAAVHIHTGGSTLATEGCGADLEAARQQIYRLRQSRISLQLTALFDQVHASLTRRWNSVLLVARELQRRITLNEEDVRNLLALTASANTCSGR
jgi:hypothetical protein